MKFSLFILFLLIGISHGFFGNIGQAITDLGNNVNQGVNEAGNQVQNGIDQAGQEAENALNNVEKELEKFVSILLDVASGIQFAANFLWDSIFSPAFDMIIDGGQLFLDDKYGAVASMINGTMALPENPLSDKYAQLVAQLKSNVHNLYEQLFLMQHDTLKALEKGELNFDDRIRAFYDKIDAIEKQLNEWAEITKYELEVYALTLVGDWTNILNQYKDNIDSSIQSMEKMFQQLTQNLMKNILDGIQNIIPNANNTIENLKNEGLLSFLNN